MDLRAEGFFKEHLAVACIHPRETRSREEHPNVIELAVQQIAGGLVRFAVSGLPEECACLRIERDEVGRFALVTPTDV